MEKSGIHENNRRHLEALHHLSKGPFRVKDAAGILNLDAGKARRFLAYLATRGWITRVHHGSYITVPLDAPDPSNWREDPWVVADRLISPCYIGGWSACEHWGFTEQVFRDIVVVTSKPMRRSQVEIQGTRFKVKGLPNGMIFGTQPVWRKQIKVAVSDPSRTIIDILDDPSLGGGMRHVVDIIRSYFASEHRDDSKLIEYAKRRGNRTVFKRLGYVVEVSSIDAFDLVVACKRNISKNLSALDPSLRGKGRILKRWNLRINATLPVQNKS